MHARSPYAKLIQWSNRLSGIARTGKAFAKDPYDVERYDQVLEISAEIGSSLNIELSPDEKLQEEMLEQWRLDVTQGFVGYACPKVSVGGIVFDKNDKILLVKNSSTKRWGFPVGMADVGFSPSNVVVKEVLEESGLHVIPKFILGIGDSLARGFNRHLHVYNILFYCELIGGKVEPKTVEIEKADFFDRESLPSALDNAGNWIEAAFEAHTKKTAQPYFD